MINFTFAEKERWKRDFQAYTVGYEQQYVHIKKTRKIRVHGTLKTLGVAMEIRIFLRNNCTFFNFVP